MLKQMYNSLEIQVVRLKKISENETYLHNDMSSRSIMKCSGHGLTLYHTIPTFNYPKEEGFGKH